MLLALLALISIRYRSATVPTSDQLQTVRMGYQPIVFGLPVFHGLEKNIFSANGLKVEATPFTSANDMLNALVSGQLDVIPGSPLVPVVALESKYPGRFRVLAHSVMTSDKPFDRILVLSSSPIKGVKDLSGKKLALIPGTTALNATKAYFRQQHLDPTNLTYVQLAPTAQLAALRSGAVDALYAYEPLVTVALDAGGVRPLTGSIYTALQEPCPLVVTIVDRRFDKTNPDAVRRLNLSLTQIFSEMRDQPSTAALSLVPYLKLSPDVAAKVNIQRMTLPGQMNIVNLQRFIDLLREIGEITVPVQADTLTKDTQ